MQSVTETRSAAGAPGSRRAGRSVAEVGRAAHAAPSGAGPDPRARPLPPGLRRPDPEAPTRRAAAPQTPAGATRSARGNGAAGSPDFPLSSPPPWQVAGARSDPELPVATVARRPRGVPGWFGLLILIFIAGIGGLIDTLSGASIKGAFAVGLVVGALVAILVVRRTEMFPVVVAPPLVYFLASAVMLYLRSGGMSNRKVLIDAATNWLVYGFPAIAGATAVVLIIAGIRMIIRK